MLYQNIIFLIVCLHNNSGSNRFLETLNSIENIKVLFIHYFSNPKIKKDIINSTTSCYLDSYEIISNYNTKYYADKHILNKFIKPILDKYDFIV